MKRLQRHQAIMDIISQGAISTQEELKASLEEAGFRTTQATLSRDIRELGLIKIKEKNGRSRYSLPKHLPKTFAPGVLELCLSVSRAEFMVVIRTELGTADVLANKIDADGRDDILGTVAGADTLLIICKDIETATAYEMALAIK